MITCILSFNPSGLSPKQVDAYLELTEAPRVGEKINLCFPRGQDEYVQHVWTVYDVEHCQGIRPEK